MAGLIQVRERPKTAPVTTTPSYTITDNGNTTMKVVVRIRPESQAEASSGAAIITRVLDTRVLVFDPKPENLPSFSSPLNLFKKRTPILGRKNRDLRFAFDRVFDETSTQRDVFEESTKNVVESVLDGVNSSVFAYGATGAGKTHTMLGTAGSPGVIFHTMMDLYRCIGRMKDEKSFEVAVSYCEVYNETIRDLLNYTIDGGSLELREDSKHGLVVSKLSRHQPKTAEELLSMLESGNKNRTQHPTDANATSSRSHAVFQVYVHQRPRTAAITAQMTCAKLSLIDLAGAERATVTTNRGARLREGANINKSLLALGNCINALAENKTKSVHIPYRNSKLTRLLKDSLGGNCRTVMIANISPSSLTYEDTYNTLKYADRAKQIKTKVVRNVLNVEFHVSRYRVIVHELQQEIAELKCKLADSKPPPPAAKLPPETSDESKRLQDLVRGVYGERLRLRKHMVDLDTQERETLLRICRKERDLHRIDTLTGNEAKRAKLAAKVSELQRQIVDIERQKQMIHEYLFSNNEAVSRVQKEVTRSSSDSAGMQELMREVVQGRKLEAENAHHWRQTKHLLRYIKAQEREIGKTERILLLALEVARKQQTLLRAHNAVTPSLREIFSNLVHAAEGEKGVAWADMNASLGASGSFRETQPETVSVAEHHGLSIAQKALFDTFLVHASPARRLSLEKYSPAVVQKPVAGILTKTGSTASNGSAASTVTTDASETTSAGGDSGVGVGKLATVKRSNSDASSVVSSLLSSRLSSIPDKPRMPTPIDDLSSSCSSNNSIYDTRLNTVLNSYHQKPNSSSSSAFRSTAAGSGRYTRLPTSRGGTPTPVGYDSPQSTPRGTPEPYLTPLPSLHKLTLTRQHSDRYKMSHDENGATYSSQPSTPSFTAANSRVTNGHPGLTSSHSSSSITDASSRVLYSTSGGEEGYHASRLNREKPVSTASAFMQPGSLMTRLQVPPRSSTSQAVPSSAAYMQLVANATRLQSAPAPPPRLHSTGKTTTKPLPPPVPPSSFPSTGRFEDNFVSALSNQISPFSAFQRHRPPPRHPPKGMQPQSMKPQTSQQDKGGPLSFRGETKELLSGRESSASSHSSSSTVKSMEPNSQRFSSPAVVTVETHSTVVSVRSPLSPSSPLPATRHSVNIGVNHTHHHHRESPGEQLPSTTQRSRPPAFVPPPPFNPTANHNASTTSRQNATCSLSTTTKCTSTSSNTSPSSKKHTSSDEKRNERETQRLRDVKTTGDSSQLNSTFTVLSHVKYGRSSSNSSSTIGSSSESKSGAGGGGGGSGLKRQHGVGGVRSVPGALKMLHVNSPHALDERDRETASVADLMAKSRKVKGVPSYLQLTKAAASKRVSKPLNKENGTAHHLLKKTGPSRGYRGPLMVQPTC